MLWSAAGDPRELAVFYYKMLWVLRSDFLLDQGGDYLPDAVKVPGIPLRKTRS